jgi:hypothetical protein
MLKRTGERFTWYCSDDLRATIEPPNCQQYKPGVFLSVRPLNWDEIIDEDHDDLNWADAGAPSGGRSRPGDGNDNDDCEREEDTLGGAKGIRKWKRTMNGKGKGKATEDGKGQGKGKGKGNGKRKGIVIHTPGGDNISRAIVLQLQKEMSERDVNTEGQQERVYSELEVSPAISMSSDDDTDSTESDGEYDSKPDSDVDMWMEDDVHAPDAIDLDGNVDMDKDGKAEKDQEEHDKMEEEEVDEE